MSIYATLWHLRFAREEEDDVDGEWHVGTPTPGYGYESGDPYEAFLPLALRIDGRTSEDDLRAVVFVVSTSKK